MAILVTCTCGKQFRVKTELAGKRGKCAACGQVISVPNLAQSGEKAVSAPPRACSTCREPLQPSAVICLNCGLDLRTGKQLPRVKSSAGVARSKPPAGFPTSAVRLWIALAAGGTCLVGVAVAVILFIWDRGPGSTVSMPEPKLGSGNVSSATNSPPGPDEKKQPTDLGSKTGPDQLVVAKLLAKVADRKSTRLNSSHG